MSKSPTREKRIRKWIDALESGEQFHSVRISKELNMTPRTVANIMHNFDNIKRPNPSLKDGLWVKI